MKILVEITGAKVACKDGMLDSWREVAGWAGGKLRQRFGEMVETRYHDLFDADCPALPQGAQLPLVKVNGEILSSGGRVSLPDLRRKIETMLKTQAA